MDSPRWKWYLTSQTAWEAMSEACTRATQSIIFEQYLIGPGKIGTEFLELLIKKSREGISVRCLLDSVGSFGLIRSKLLYRMQEAGIEVVFFNWIIPFSDSQESVWYFRNHRRSLVIDQKIGFTGGICFEDEMRDWRETQVELEGGIVADLCEAFESAWARAKKHMSASEKQPPESSNDFAYMTSAPLPRKRYLYYEFSKAIHAAKKTIFLTTPYFLPDWKLMTSLTRAVQRGVDVRILIPMTVNHILVGRGAQTYFTHTLRSGIKIFRYTPTMIHTKTAVIDSAWATIGSLNLDSVSLRYNFEANIVSTHAQFAKEIEEQFHKDCEETVELSLQEWSKRPILDQFLELLVWPIRKFL